MAITVSNSVTNEVIEHLEALPRSLQEQVLSLVRALDISMRHGVSGRKLLRFAGAIPETELRLISTAIEQGCEQVDLNEW
jgi:hypothetical protein